MDDEERTIRAAFDYIRAILFSDNMQTFVDVWYSYTRTFGEQSTHEEHAARLAEIINEAEAKMIGTDVK